MMDIDIKVFGASFDCARAPMKEQVAAVATNVNNSSWSLILRLINLLQKKDGAVE